jgi:hypothetical protein
MWPRRTLRAALLLVLAGLMPASSALAAIPRATIYVVRLDPVDRVARDFAKSGYGGGIDVSWPFHGTQGLLSVIGGIEAVSLLSKVKTFQDQLTGLRVEQHTGQFYSRFFLGGELGPHGNGFLEPYANAALALVVYGISTDVVIPDDVNRQNSINQNLSSRTEAAFGWSAGTGVNFNFGRWGIDGGVRFLKQYGVPQQLGDGAVTIQPSYMQYRLGVSLPIRN